MRRSGGLEVHELYTGRLQRANGAANALAKYSGLLSTDAQPEELESTVEAGDIREGARVRCFAIEWVPKACLDGAPAAHVRNNRTTERGYVGKIFRVVKRNEKGLHAAHGQSSHGSMVAVG